MLLYPGSGELKCKCRGKLTVGSADCGTRVCCFDFSEVRVGLGRFSKSIR